MDNNIFVLLTVFFPVFATVVNLALVRYNRAQRWVGFGASALAWGSSIVVLLMVINDGPQIYRMGGLQPPYGIIFVADMLAALFGVMATSVMMGGFIYAVHSHDKAVTYPAFLPLFSCMATGLNGAFFTGDLFTLFVFIELMVLSSVGLVAVADNEHGLEAAVKYLFINGMGTLFLLLGIGSIYTTFGTLNMADIANQLAAGDRPLLAASAAAMLMSAFLLKSAVFPFHFWQPDFHTTAPVPVHSVLSSVVVKVGIYGIIRIITLLFTEEAALLENLLIVLGIIGIFFGSLGALRTYDGKRMLAYSTIGQIGFILVAIGWGTPLALAAAIVYAFNHAFIKSALLMIMGLVASYNKAHTVNYAKIRGAGRPIPWLIGALWFVGGMSLAGLPPMNGFISKFVIVRSGVEIGAWLPLGLAVASGAITLTYMFRAWQYVFQTKVPKDEMDVEIIEQGDGLLAPALLIGVCIFLGLYAQPLIELADATVAQLSNPDIYIAAVNLPMEVLE